MRHRWIVALVLGIPGSAALAQAGPVDPDGCSLLPAAEIAAVTGEPMLTSRGEVKDRIAYRDIACRNRGKTWRVEVHVERGRDADGVKLYLQTLKGVVQKTTQNDAKEVKGLGDQAWWGPIGPTSGILHVVRGTDVLWIHTYGDGPGAGTLEKTRALMERLLANSKSLLKG